MNEPIKISFDHIKFANNNLPVIGYNPPDDKREILKKNKAGFFSTVDGR